MHQFCIKLHLEYLFTCLCLCSVSFSYFNVLTNASFPWIISRPIVYHTLGVYVPTKQGKALRKQFEKKTIFIVVEGGIYTQSLTLSTGREDLRIKVHYLVKRRVCVRSLFPSLVQVLHQALWYDYAVVFHLFIFVNFHVLLCRSQTKYQIVLTKTDTVFPIDVARRAMQIEEVNFVHLCYIFIEIIIFFLETNFLKSIWFCRTSRQIDLQFNLWYEETNLFTSLLFCELLQVGVLNNQILVLFQMMVSSKSGAGIRSLRTVLSKIARFAKI